MPIHVIYGKMKKQNKTAAEIDSAIRKYMEKYFYVRKKALVIIHANNYHRLSEHEKKFVCLAWLPSGKVKLHKINNYCICLPPNSSLIFKF